MKLRTVTRIAAALACVLFAIFCLWSRQQITQLGNDRALLAAVKQSDIERVNTLLAAGANSNARDVPVKHRSFLDYIHDLRFRPPTAVYETALMRAVTVRSPQIVKTLISAGADVNSVDKYKDTALMMAAFNGDNIDDMLYTREVNILDDTGKSPHILLCHKLDAEIEKLLIAGGANVNVAGDGGLTALMLSTDYDNVECARVLISSGADVNSTAEYGQTALSLAVGQGHPRVATVLRAAGAKD